MPDNTTPMLKNVIDLLKFLFNTDFTFSFAKTQEYMNSIDVIIQMLRGEEF